ncbi:MAG TPA: MoaD/ThiS family protein [Nitrososphaeraceae archaeon]|nr:MoaD/ThiS family protein [Candidatus Nitrosocosmicus sp.]HEX5978372.1 MoaD/ThiS family protein [Nitrososphaeraceae archaeon]
MRSDTPGNDKIKVKLFAILRERVGESEITITVPSGITVNHLNSEILKKYPQLKSFSNKFVTSVNCKVTTGDTVITSKDEVALLPPVSGG